MEEMVKSRNATDQSTLDIGIWPTITVSGVKITTVQSFSSFLQLHRNDALMDSLTMEENLLYYSNITYALLNALVDSVQVPPDTTLWKEFVAYDSILRAGNVGGIQRSLGSLFYAKCDLAQSTWIWFIELESQKNGYLDMSYQYFPATKDMHGAVAETLLIKKDEIVGDMSQASCVGASDKERMQMELAWFDNMTEYLDHIDKMWLHVEEMMMKRLYTLHQVTAHFYILLLLPMLSLFLLLLFLLLLLSLSLPWVSLLSTS